MIDYTTAPKNSIVQSLVDKMLVRCPNNAPVGAKRARDESNSRACQDGTPASDSPAAPLCSWTGKMECLEDHLMVCESKPLACAFAVHGCTFTGLKGALDIHYSTAAHEHSALSQRKFVALERTVAELSSRVAAQGGMGGMGPGGPTPENRMRAIAEEQCRQLVKFADQMYPATRTVRWTIHGLRKKIQSRQVLHSEPFLMSIAGRGTYKMQLQAVFGRRGDKGVAAIDGKVLAVYVAHVSDVDYCNAMPIYLKGTEMWLLADPDGEDVSALIDEDAMIAEMGRGWGWGTFCEDVLGRGLTRNDSLELLATVKLQGVRGGGFSEINLTSY